MPFAYVERWQKRVLMKLFHLIFPQIATLLRTREKFIAIDKLIHIEHYPELNSIILFSFLWTYFCFPQSSINIIIKITKTGFDIIQFFRYKNKNNFFKFSVISLTRQKISRKKHCNKIIRFFDYTRVYNKNEESL